VGSVADEREVTARGNLTVEREGGYRIETVVYEDGRRRLTGTTEVRGVDTLTPAYAESTVRFHRFDADLPSVQYHVEDVDDNRTTLTVSTYLTNGGDDAAGDLRLVVQARQADSNIVADEAEVDVGAIRPGRTETPTAELTVPTGYDYYLDAVLWKDGVIVGTARSAANLDPTETIDVNATRREVGLRVGEFEPDEEPDEDAPAPERTPTPSASSGPGFGVVAAVIALLGALAARRWSA
jgi:PGF-CTERM protein